jgi:hypothetical protein
MLNVEVRAAGARRALIPQWQVPLPPADAGRAEPLTLRELIARIVRAEVAAFDDRQERRNLLRVLTEQEVAQGVAAGRVRVPGPPEIAPQTKVDIEQAVGIALLGFEDGLYLVFIDGREHRDLDEQVFPGPDSTITFVRLVMLAGA